MSNIELFNQARDYLIVSLEPTVDCYLTGAWDPIVKYNLLRETNKIIHKDLAVKFPSLPAKLRPQLKFRIFEEAKSIECGIQNYINNEKDLLFLGTAAFMTTMFDFYFRLSYDPRFEYMFIGRYGHKQDNYVQGSKTAKVEYKSGQQTPLAVAYGMAIQDGYINS